MRPAAYDDQVIDCFNVGQAGDAFDLVRHAILLFEVMALMRLWDDTEDDVQSILTLVSGFGIGHSRYPSGYEPARDRVGTLNITFNRELSRVLM